MEDYDNFDIQFCTDDEVISEFYDRLDLDDFDSRLEKIISVFIAGNWQQREEIYKKILG